ncbi:MULTISPECIES: hypothetical protein, partial [unclassified Leisingera]|uniref:hypothetical protein n=1 Tax=unclassified Leisingera TaxID=2614906 RepID=UPI0019D32F00
TLVAHGHLPAAIRSGSLPAALVECEARYIPITQFIFLTVNTLLPGFQCKSGHFPHFRRR